MESRMRRKAHVRFGGEGEKTHLRERRKVRLALILRANGSTGNGEAFGRLAGIADKVLGLTGTPFNGRASSLFNLEYHLNERVRDRFPWGGADRLSRKQRGSRGFQTVIESAGKQRGRAESRWVEQMGVRECVVEERPTYDQLVQEQIGLIRERRGTGDLDALLHQGETWTIS